MYDSILVPTDGSTQAMYAAEEAIRLAAELEATVHALYVVDAFEAKIVPITKEEDGKRDEYEAYGADVTGEVAEMAEDAGVECVTAVRDGVTHDQIASYVDENDIELVVMGSRGLTNIEEMLLGSTADKVIRSVEVPVTVVHKQPNENLDWMIRGADTVHG
ncbi:universal stress protein [Haloarculaceae archaeon H-GB11]|nr:universal stress protein [Haloarculaceae archaeon H-GB11]